jgi:hypothetical protein
MANLLRAIPEQQKESARPITNKGEAQRRRRESERVAASGNDARAKPGIQP